MTACQFCGKPLNRCRMDRRGLCTRDPKSDGIAMPRTKAERAYDKRVRKA